MHTGNGNKRKVAATDNTKGNSPHKLLTNQTIPKIITAAMPPVNQTTADGSAKSGRTFHAVRVVLCKEIVTGMAQIITRVFKDPTVVNWNDIGGTIPKDRSTVKIPPRATTPVQIGTGPSVPPINTRSYEI